MKLVSGQFYLVFTQFQYQGLALCPNPSLGLVSVLWVPWGWGLLEIETHRPSGSCLHFLLLDLFDTNAQLSRHSTILADLQSGWLTPGAWVSWCLCLLLWFLAAGTWLTCLFRSWNPPWPQFLQLSKPVRFILFFNEPQVQYFIPFPNTPKYLKNKYYSSLKLIQTPSSFLKLASYLFLLQGPTAR